MEINLLYKTIEEEMEEEEVTSVHLINAIEALRDKAAKLKIERDQILAMYNREHEMFKREIAETREARKKYFTAIREG